MSGMLIKQTNTKIKREPLRPTAAPTTLWQILGTDILQYQVQIYLIVIDYYLKHPELALLGADLS